MNDSSDCPPFQVLLEHAAKLKSAEQASERRYFDSQSPWLQSSLFQSMDRFNREVTGSFDARCKAATEAKLHGNALIGEKRPIEAISAYCKALSFFYWFRPLHDDWKKRVSNCSSRCFH